ncbi:NAD-glutamate dehydrogenase [Janibacter sp. Soil728]|uniref:NAD-glutamate dehydrogenase n=1 Tax=Janibacter sp. Soil728 TaxID=1736393 RepID=UPI0006F35166|nr:NAD-glutamate dehydrogenase [Janibacter sp. Soil728]KRE38087.1 NAD-glutamate dehydrogenase [Janibacter sp. Soil728]
MAQLPAHTATDPASGLAEELVTAATAADVEPPFVERYFRHVDETALREHSVDELVGMATTHRSVAGRRAPDETIVEIVDGVLHVVTADRPFLVDSVLGELGVEGVAVSLLIHPLFAVRRDSDGTLVEVVDQDPRTGHSDPHLYDESWIRIEFSDRVDVSLLRERVIEVVDAVAAAVDDWDAMKSATLEAAASLEDGRGTGTEQSQGAATEFLRWLVDDHFTFIGSRDHLVDAHASEAAVVTPISGSGLGMLRMDSTAESITPLGSSLGHTDRAMNCLSIGKSRAVLPVHRVTHPDLVAVRFTDDEGRVIERRLAGLFSSTAYTSSVLSIPLIADKVRRVLDDAGWARDSHSGAFAMRLFETFPRDELFQAPVDHLREVVTRIQQLVHRMQTATFLRLDSGEQFVTAIVYLPRDRYTTVVRHRIEERLCEATGADEVSFTAHVSEEPMARLYYILRSSADLVLPQGDAHRALDESVADAVLTWQERLVRAAHELVGDEIATTLLTPWIDGFPVDYEEDFDVAQAVADLKNLTTLGETTPFACALYKPRRGHGGGDDPRIRRFKLFSAEELILDDLMPIFRDLGVKVIEEEPYTLTRADGMVVGIYDFSLRTDDQALWEVHTHEELRELVESAVMAVRGGRTESDGFNALIIRAGLTWRQVGLLRAIGRYLRQTGGSWGQTSLEAALVDNNRIAADIVALFEARFDPEIHDGLASEQRAVAEQEIVDRIDTALEEVTSLEHDRIIRAFLGVIAATLRTSYFVRDEQGEPLPRMSFKIEPAKVPDMPKPHPAFEIWVHSPQVEGVHLRFGAVARGGLRWSDRRDDFRTEVLGLVKAQMVKNAVIVPTGSKGGFFGKQLPDPSLDREAWMDAGRSAYRAFISGLLDVTDNRVEGAIVPPQRVVRHDGDDSYLVVAADKGTATFSDLANSIAREYGFWLDDAFASGGSVGYDHKGMGITARGAWESVKRHFRELDHDTQAQDFTVVGIGDMSGDVFGNGMLLSEHIRLVAAFNHLHIFIDPQPQAASSHAERRRLFELPRSTWDDYDRTLISEGGGVWSRSAKSVPVGEQAAAALGLDGPTSMTPNELIHLILQAPVDLLWNGGIGTYVKSGAETHGEVGDRANDAIRVDGAQLRCRVVGEGGNLGATQRGRIEAAGAGVRINTDAVDNSAGVDTSDREVNIKILLGEAIRQGTLDPQERVELLASMTDEVAEQVLRDNYEQNVLLGNARAQDGAMLVVHERLMESLVERGDLDRELEFLPSSSQVAERMSAHEGLSSPELAVLLAYSKMSLKADLLESDLPDDPATERQLTEYFPSPLRGTYGEALRAHPLRREIVTTAVANDLVNRGGITFVQRAAEETSATSAQVVRAFLVSREVFGLDDFVARVEALDNVVPTKVQTRLYLELRRLMDRSVRWFLSNRPGRLNVTEEIERFAEPAAQIAPQIPELLRGSQAERLGRKTQELVDAGVPSDLARRTAILLDLYSVLDIVDTAQEGEGTTPLEVAECYYLLSETFGIDELLIMVTRLPREERWDAMARGALRDDLYATLHSLTSSVLGREGSDAAERFAEWSREHDEAVERVQTQLAGIRQLTSPGVAALSVALRTLRSVTR